MPRVNLYSGKTKEVQKKGGLNWGLSNGNVCKSDAYIALNKVFFRQYPSFFPPQGNTITVLWDEGTLMTCLLEGTQKVNGLLYPKQLSTYNDKSILGVYLRNRLGVSESHLITRNDLRNYGREHVDIEYDQEMEFYRFDFSI